MRTEEQMASSSSILPPEQAARLTEAVGAIAQQWAEATAPLRDALDALPGVALPMRSLPTGGFPTVALPQSLVRSFRRWASMSPRQRARVLVAEIRKRAGNLARAYAGSLRIALGQTVANLAALVSERKCNFTDADPPHGPPLHLVLLDSTRPIHGPPLPA